MKNKNTIKKKSSIVLKRKVKKQFVLSEHMSSVAYEPGNALLTT